MLQLKEGVIIAGNKYTNAILAAVQDVYRRHDWPVTITSGRDSHDTGYHPLDRALDIRVIMIPPAQRDNVAAEIRAELPYFYDVVNETERVDHGVVVKGAHFHIEADAKREVA